jgi:colanic acid biosynthesis glycosyl transferase WcaI
MKTIIISCVFSPEPIVSARTSTDLAQELYSRGIDVQVITAFPNRPVGKLFTGYKQKLFTRERHSVGYKILRCFSFLSPQSSLASRFLENFSFGMVSGLAVLFIKRPDVIYANTWPIFAVGILRLVASLRRIPLVISVQDVYPEALLYQGRLKEDDLVYKILIAIDRWIAKGCHTIILISESLARIYREERGVSADRIKVIPNWLDKKVMIPSLNGEFRKERGISEDAFVLVYGGNIGRAAGVEIVLQAMKQLISGREIVFIIAGSGSQLTDCQKQASEITNTRVLFHTPWASEETFKVLAAADVLVLPTSGSQSLVSVPSKMISYMLTARPILAAVHQESDIAEVIGRTGCGWVVPPDSPEQLVRKIKEILKTSEDQLVQMGQSGREYALQNFVSEICLPKVIDIILSAIKL